MDGDFLRCVIDRHESAAAKTLLLQVLNAFLGIIRGSDDDVIQRWTSNSYSGVVLTVNRRQIAKSSANIWNELFSAGLDYFRD